MSAAAAATAGKKSVTQLGRKLTDVGKRLAVQAVLIDSHIFRRSGPQNETALLPPSLRPVWDPSRLGTEIQTKDMLVKQVRKELKERGMDSVGKPFEIRKRLQDARNDEQSEERLLAKIMDVESAEVIKKKDESKTPQGEDLRAKYAARLRAKTSSARNDQTTEAATLATARKHISQSEGTKFRHGPPGLRTLLDFIRARSMLLGLLTRPEAKETEIIDISAQASFDFVLDFMDTGTDSVATSCKRLEIEPHKTLVLLDEPASISRVRRAGAISCLMLEHQDLHASSQERWQIPSSSLTRQSDFSVSHCTQVISLINELNGISFRETVPVY